MSEQVKPDLEAMKAEIDKMSNTQRIMAASACLLTQAYRLKGKIEDDQFIDVVKHSVETLIRVGIYEGRLKMLEYVTDELPKNSLPPEAAVVLFAAVADLDRREKIVQTKVAQMKNLMEMLRDAEKVQ